jgi:hypothetical protein
MGKISPDNFGRVTSNVRINQRLPQEPGIDAGDQSWKYGSISFLRLTRIDGDRIYGDNYRLPFPVFSKRPF